MTRSMSDIVKHMPLENLNNQSVSEMLDVAYHLEQQNKYYRESLDQLKDDKIKYQELLGKVGSYMKQHDLSKQDKLDGISEVLEDYYIWESRKS